MSDNPSLVQAL